MRTLLLALLLPGLALAQADAPPADPPRDTTLVDDRRIENREDAPLPEKILTNPPPEAAPTVSIRTDGSGDVVEEYRMNGQIYMVKVRPPRGIPYTLMDTNGDGRLDSHDSDGPVRPVYWTVYEWN
jgi:hypothetical protein